eukprot:GHVT01062792.1.p1 GENE.GHVT01062792.1~~GHVT01062792.1.p1  ORF type:complete len:596 (+),score=134.91 GHVT01062792.1:186-1790(+)
MWGVVGHGGLGRPFGLRFRGPFRLFLCAVAALALSRACQVIGAPRRRAATPPGVSAAAPSGGPTRQASLPPAPFATDEESELKRFHTVSLGTGAEGASARLVSDEGVEYLPADRRFPAAAAPPPATHTGAKVSAGGRLAYPADGSSPVLLLKGWEGVAGASQLGASPLFDSELARPSAERPGTVEYGPPNTVNRAETISLPPRRVCGKGWYDADVDACVWYDKQDKILPIYECPAGSELRGDFCYGRIFSDFELDCPNKYDANVDKLCVRAIVYSPSRVSCPEGFELQVTTPARVKNCVKVVYVPPVPRPIQLQQPPPALPCAVGAAHCPKPPRHPPPPQQWIVECPDGGKLVKIKQGNKTACKVKIVVPPEPKETCKHGYRWSILEGYGGACVRLWAMDSVNVCPRPTPKLGPGFGDWETPAFRYDPIDRCVADRAKATAGHCPWGFALQRDWCYRKYFLPYYVDCNNLEGFGFHWDPVKEIASCVFHYDPFKWSRAPSHPSKREAFDAKRLFLFSNPFEVQRAATAGEVQQM